MKILSWLNENIERSLLISLFMSFCFLMVLNIFLIVFFNNALPWATEAVLTLFVFFVWIGISYAFKERKHISVTAFTNLLPLRVRSYLEVFIQFVTIAFLILLLVAGFQWMTHSAVQSKSSLLLNYPMWLFYLSAPLGTALSIIRILQNIRVDIKKIRSVG